MTSVIAVLAVLINTRSACFCLCVCLGAFMFALKSIQEIIAHSRGFRKCLIQPPAAQRKTVVRQTGGQNEFMALCLIYTPHYT